MRSIEEHIKFLFYIKSDFIIPKLGYFYSKYTDAKFSSTEDTYYPRVKQFFFSDKEKEDKDGFLINYIAEKDNISMSESKMKINDYVIYIHKSLSDSGIMNLSEIGYFEQKQEEVVFFFNKLYNFDIKSYGIKPIGNDTFTNNISPVNERKKESSPTQQRKIKNNANFFVQNNIINDNFEEKPISMFWNNFLKLALIIYILFSLGYLYHKNVKPISTKNTFIINESSIINLDFSMGNDTIQMENITPKKKKEIYYLIIASFNSNEVKKVKKFIRNFNATHKGFTLEIVEDKKVKRKRISCGSFENREEVDKMLKKIREIVEDSWVYITYINE